MLSIEQHNTLAGILNSTFGKPSIKGAGHAIRYNLRNGTEGSLFIELRFETPVNFNPRLGLTSQRKQLDSQSLGALNECVRDAKKQFREKEGISLKLKVHAEPTPMVETISHNPELVRARYSRSIVYSLSA